MRTKVQNAMKRGIGTLLALVMLMGLLPASVLAANTMTIRVTKNTDESNPTVVGVYQKQPNHFVEMTSFAVTYAGTDGAYDVYTATPAASGQLIVEAHIPGVTNKAAKTVDVGASVTLDLQAQAAWSAGRYADDMYTNLDDSGTLNLAAGETFILDTFRVWQALGSSMTENVFIEPEFYFEVTGGSIATKRIGNAGREQLEITATNAGVSVIKITYGSVTFNNSVYGAIDPRNTYAVVVNVNGGADFDTGINTSGGVQARNDFDTFYFDKEIGTRDFTFTPESGSTVRVHAPLNAADWNTAWTVGTEDSGSWTVPLVDGRNIIEITNGASMRYQLVKARGVSVSVENFSTPGEDIAVGETARITIRGIEPPVSKLTGVYNPGFTIKPYLQYTAGAASVKSDASGQYDVLQKAFVIDYALMNKDENVLDGQIQGGGGFWGVGLDLGAHRSITAEGVSPSVGLAPDMGAVFFGALPQITLTVDESRSAISPFTEDGWLVVECTGGTNASDSLLKILQDAVGGLGLESITKLKITGTMTNWDFYNGANVTSRGPLHGSSNGTNALLTELVELDLSGVTSPFPNQALRALPKLEKLRLPAAFASAVANNGNNYMIFRMPMLTTIVCGEGPYAEGVIDLTGFIGEAFFPGVFWAFGNGVASPPAVHVVFPGDKDVPINFFGGTSSDGVGITGMDAIFFTGTVLGDIGNAFKKTALKSTVVAYVPDGVTDTSKLAPYFDNVKTISEYNADAVVAEARAELADAVAVFRQAYSENPGYSAYVWEVLMQAISDADTILDYVDYRVTAASFTGAAAAVEAVIAVLVPDKTPLLAAIVAANEYAESDWTESSWADFRTALVAAQTAYYDKDATLSEVVAARGNLASAVSGLTEPLGNKEWLNEYIVQYGSVTASDFTADSEWAVFDAAMNAAKAIVLVSGATVKEVDAVEEALANALRNVVYIGDLRHEVNNAQSLTQANYTVGTWSALANALAEAEIVLVKADAAKAEVDAAAFVLRQAAMALETANTGGGNGGSGITPARSVTVTFRLIGDTKHGDFASHEKYVTWLATRSYTFNNVDRITIYDLFTRAMSEAGLGYIGADSNYVSSIQAPAVLGGFWLSEFDNGPNSGWMYTVNGVHAGRGLKDEYVYNGNSVIWHYADDFKLETGFEGGTPAYIDRWLEAADVDPSASNAGGAGGGANTQPRREISVPAQTVNGAATVTVATAVITDALAAVQAALAVPSNADVTGEIVLHVTGAAPASAVRANISAAAVQAMADAGNVVFTINSGLGAVTLDGKTLAGVAKGAAANAEVSISISAAQEEAVGSVAAFALTVTANGVAVRDFAGTATVFLPYAAANAAVMTVYHVDNSGVWTEMTDAKYDADKKGFVFTTTHFSLFIIAAKEAALAEWENPFMDISSADWFYDAVRYVYENGLMNGTGAAEFEPQIAMTRAMMVQVLYNFEGCPSVAAANPFKDVADGQWYTNAVIWANAEGIVSGYGNDNFGPSDEITREQMVVILYNYARVRGLDVSAEAEVSVYADAAEIADWALAAMRWASAEGLISGRSATTLAPKGTAVRAEIASVLMRFVENVVK